MTNQSHSWRPKPRQRSKFYPRLEVTVPTLCFVLIFLVFLQAMAVIAGRHHGFPVHLPVTATGTVEPGVLRSDAVQLSVTTNGDFFLEGTRIAISDLTVSIRSKLLPGVERRIYVQVDARATYADVETALDAIRHAGISNITIMVEQRRDSIVDDLR
jgi:biopolymer transport protein ExbD/biopolymer transport protein TolR